MIEEKREEELIDYVKENFTEGSLQQFLNKIEQNDFTKEEMFHLGCMSSYIMKQAIFNKLKKNENTQ